VTAALVNVALKISIINNMTNNTGILIPPFYFNLGHVKFKQITF